MNPLRKKYSVDDSIDSWDLFERTFPAGDTPIMSRRVFDVGLDVDRIKRGLKFHSSNHRARKNRSISTSDSRPKTSSDDRQLVLTPRLKERRSSPSLRPDKPETVQPQQSPEPIIVPSASPTIDIFTHAPVQSPTMNGDRSSPEPYIEPDDVHNFDLNPPPPRKPVKSLETYSEHLFSEPHLRTILRDPAFFMRFTAFLNRYQPHNAQILTRYLEAQKAIKAVEYANYLAEALKAIPGDSSSQIPCAAATLDARFESRVRRATETLVNEALPAYITQCFTKIVTESMVREITGATMPVMRDLVGGLAEVFCLSDPSIRDNPIVYASEEFYRTTQYGRDYVIGRNCRFLQGPKTDRNAVARIREAVRSGQESFETILNYRRDGSPFMNLVMTAPLYDNKGTVRYFIGAQVDISGLVEEGRGLESLERLLNESKRNRNSVRSFANQNHMKALSEFGEMLSMEESSIIYEQGRSREGSVNDGDYGGSKSARRIQQGRRDPNTRLPRRVLGIEDEDEQEKEKNAWAFNSMGPSGKLPGVYQNYLLLRPHPSLRIIFVSPALRIPGLLQSPFLSRIGGPPHVRQGLASAFEHGEDITAKVTWLPQGRPDPDGGGGDSVSLASRPDSSNNPSSISGRNTDEGAGTRTRYISCTPLTGSDDNVGVWMVVMVENESITGALLPPSRAHAVARYGSSTAYSHSNNHNRNNNNNNNNPHTPLRSEHPATQDTTSNGSSPLGHQQQRVLSPGGTNTGAKRFHNDIGGGGARGRQSRALTDFYPLHQQQQQQQKGGGGAKSTTTTTTAHNVHRNLFSDANGVMTMNPVLPNTAAAGTGKVVLVGGGGEGEGEGEGDEGLLDGVGDPGTGGVEGVR